MLTNQTTQKSILDDRVKSELNIGDIEQEKLIRTFITSPSAKKIIITIPAYNEEKNIGGVIFEIKEIMDKTNYTYQIMVLDDGSVDRTKEITKKNGVLFFSNKGNLGLAHTFKKEMEICIGLGADIIVHIDADGQYPPIYIPMMIESVLDGADLVLGSRFGNGIYSGTIWRKLGNLFFAKVFCLLLRKNIHDTTTGFRAFTKEIAQLPIKSKFTYTQEQLIKVIRGKKTIKEIPIQTRITRKSKLFNNILEYFYRAVINILRIII